MVRLEGTHLNKYDLLSCSYLYRISVAEVWKKANERTSQVDRETKAWASSMHRFTRPPEFRKTSINKTLLAEHKTKENKINKKNRARLVCLVDWIVQSVFGSKLMASVQWQR